MHQYRPWKRILVATMMFSARSFSARLPAFCPSAASNTAQRQSRLLLLTSPPPRTHQKANSYSSPTRLFHSSPLRKGGILSKVKDVAKKISPTSWFQSDEEKRKTDERNRIQKTLKSDMKQVLKDAPLPLRMMGSIIAPLLGGLMSEMAETAATSKEFVDEQLQKAKSFISTDQAVIDAIGEPMQIGAPFQQGMSSSNINGNVQMRLEMAFPVAGSRTQGVGRVVATKDAIQLLEVIVNGRTISVSTTGGSNRVKARFSASNFNKKDDDDDIIEAEIVEKVTK